MIEASPLKLDQEPFIISLKLQLMTLHFWDNISHHAGRLCGRELKAL